MSVALQMMKCQQCGKATRHVGNRPNHILHLLLSLITVGLWLIPWFLISAASGGMSCEACGKKWSGMTSGAILGLVVIVGVIILIVIM